MNESGSYITETTSFPVTIHRVIYVSLYGNGQGSFAVIDALRLDSLRMGAVITQAFEHVAIVVEQIVAILL